MTGYAALDAPGRRWELRGVNGRGLDLRFRLPDRPAGLEPEARRLLQARVARGSLTLSLRLGGDEAAGPRLDPAALEAALDAVAAVSDRAAARHLDLVATDPARILALPGVWGAGAAAEVSLGDLKAELASLVEAFDAARAKEGEALRTILAAQVDAIEALVARADALGPERAEAAAAALREALARLGAQADGARIEAEVALLLVRGDVAEELDRLRVHVAAARDLLDAEGPVGRRLDFLVQEFVREANTLCSKSAHAGLTAVGLEMKAAIDRLREQAMNVE
ncbi:YicC/YloC family endoribonuclease [Jannaschia sp. W003]|uniref:YicC/YloC family endoribonuclease n=1 Tax=Jannaschia sp. W003 TaxID=2867012 RepID=UPI0021A4A881|nr:YicC/YloC family endoribonuclease [Jannaschia sp. W003]UWQ23038.1 YicC family protein [Jannaschia sp. W003]